MRRHDFAELEAELGAFSVDISRFEKKECIDRGGFSEVWIALDRSTGDLVCLKQMNSDLDPKTIKHFIRDITTMAAADHPFFLHLIGFSFSRKLTLVSEYVVNGNLFNFRQSPRNRARLDGTKRTIIAMAIAHAMMYLHSLNIIHRDLKSLNILLDENLLPRLCDFGIARELDRQPLTHAIGTPHWMAPEMLSGSEYGPEVDVYSFAMILYELLTDEVPWKDVRPETMMKNVLVDKIRPKLPRDCPDSMKDLIRMSWAQNPRNRPSFAEIYEMFANHEVEFEDTDERVVNSLARQLGKVKLGRNIKPSTPVREERSWVPSRSSPKSVRYEHESYTGRNNQISRKSGIRSRKSPFIDIDAIADTRNYSFRSELKKASEGLQKVQSRQFMTTIADHLANSKIRPPELVAILNALQQILQRKCHLEMFVELEMQNLLPLEAGGDVTNAALDVLLVLFEKSPRLFEVGFESTMESIIQSSPQKAVILLSAFAKSFGNMANGWDLVDLLLQKSKVFFKAYCGAELVSTLFFLALNFTEFREARLEYVLKVFMAGLTCKDTNTVSLCYSGLSQFFNKNLDVDFGLVTMHLNDETLCEDCLNLLIRIRDIPCLPELIASLVNCAKSRIEATLCLLRIAALEEGAGLILRRPSWITCGMPTVVDTLRLFLAIMTHSNLIPIVAKLKQTGLFLKMLCDESDSRFFTYMSAIIRKFPVDEKLVQSLSEGGVLTSIFRTALEFGDDIALNATTTILLKLGKAAFSPEYLLMAPYLKEMITADRQSSRTAVAAVTLLSQYPLCAKKFKDLKLDRVFKQLVKDREYREYAEVFLENMSVTNFY